MPWSPTLLYLDAAEVADLCEEIDPLEVVATAFLAVRSGEAEVAEEAALRWQAPDGTAARSLVLPARHGHVYGCKIINACLGNIDRGLPRAHGLVVLHDHETAAPVAILEAGRISALRTAAVSLVAVDAIRGLETVRHAAFLGCGRQSATHAELLAARAPLERVAVFDLDPDRSAAFAADLERRAPAAEVAVAASPRSALEGAAVAIAATTTTTSYVPPEWLDPGATFVNVSLDDATEELLLGCDHLFVDDWHLVSEDDTRLLGRLAGAGRVAGPGEAAPQGGRGVDADIATLVAGAYERPIAPELRVVVNPFGMGVHDVALAGRVYEAARARQAGTPLPR